MSICFKQLPENVSRGALDVPHFGADQILQLPSLRVGDSRSTTAPPLHMVQDTRPLNFTDPKNFSLQLWTASGISWRPCLAQLAGELSRATAKAQGWTTGTSSG